MAAAKKTKMVAIQHLDSGYKTELPEDDYNQLQARIKEKYKITGTSEVSTPSEIDPTQN